MPLTPPRNLEQNQKRRGTWLHSPNLTTTYNNPILDYHGLQRIYSYTGSPFWGSAANPSSHQGATAHHSRPRSPTNLENQANSKEMLPTYLKTTVCIVCRNKKRSYNAHPCANLSNTHVKTQCHAEVLFGRTLSLRFATAGFPCLFKDCSWQSQGKSSSLLKTCT